MNKFQITTTLLILILSNSAYAYKEFTHEDMSSNAVNISVLSVDQTLLIDFGLLPFRNEQKFTNPDDPNSDKLTIEELVQNGANFEDNSPRFLNHFYNPINNAPLTVGVELGFTSPDWALEDIGDVTSVLSGSQEYSYKEAMNYFFLALTSQTEEIREQNWGKVFQTLGQVIHHVQDMAQPDHVRNDQHNDATDPSWYEEYTNDHKGDAYFTNLMSGNTYPIPEFPTVRDFWTTQVTDLAITNRRGIADFTNRNFVSKDSIFLFNNGIIVPSPDFPLPIPNITPTTVDIADPSIKGAQGQALCDQIKALSLFPFPNSACFIDFVSTPITGEVAGEPTTNTRAASYSIFDKKLQDHNVDAIFTREDGSIDTIDRSFTLNEFNFKAAHNYLIPRAVAYSAGLINHFFKARFIVTFDSVLNQFVMQNKSGHIMSGELFLYADDVYGQKIRRFVKKWNVGLLNNDAEIGLALPADMVTFGSKLSFVYKGNLDPASNNEEYIFSYYTELAPSKAVGASVTTTTSGGDSFFVRKLTLYNNFKYYTFSLVLQSGPYDPTWGQRTYIKEYPWIGGDGLGNLCLYEFVGSRTPNDLFDERWGDGEKFARDISETGAYVENYRISISSPPRIAQPPTIVDCDAADYGYRTSAWAEGYISKFQFIFPSFIPNTWVVQSGVYSDVGMSVDNKFGLMANGVCKKANLSDINASWPSTNAMVIDLSEDEAAANILLSNVPPLVSRICTAPKNHISVN